jgi:vesicle transport through interaction with t-SNAREs protein 1
VAGVPTSPPSPLPSQPPVSPTPNKKQELGTQILGDLHRQRETMVHARDTLHGADDNIGRARKILSNMSRRMFQNKLIMGGIIAFLVAAIALIIWVKTKN